MYFFPFNVRDYLTKTRHLNLLEDLAYRRCLDCYYTEEKPLPIEPERVARLIAMPNNVTEVELVLREFFELTEEGWSNDRADFEIEAYRARADRARENGKRGGRKPKANPAGTQQEPSGVPNPNPDPAQPKTKPRNQETKKPTLVLGFAEFWTAYPKKVSKAEALKAWGKIPAEDGLTEKIMAALATAKQSRDWTKDDGQFIPHASTWLNQRRWEDEVAGSSGEPEDKFGGLL
jgi:uncharacterized protein YdaU (DUF1376 family)